MWRQNYIVYKALVRITHLICSTGTYQNTPRRIPDHLRGSSTSAGGVNNGARGVNNGAGGVNNGAGGVNNGAGGVNNGAGGVNNGAGGVNNGDGFVMFALRTTRRNHAERLPVLLNTWMTKAAPGQVSLTRCTSHKCECTRYSASHV